MKKNVWQICLKGRKWLFEKHIFVKMKKHSDFITTEYKETPNQIHGAQTLLAAAFKEAEGLLETLQHPNAVPYFKPTNPFHKPTPYLFQILFYITITGMVISPRQ